MKRLSILVLVFLVLGVFAASAQDWKPTKPIQVIVPWGAGGSTDQIVRLVAGELETEIGQKIVVVNQPGASGSVGTNTVLQAAHDGYTWASGAAADLGTYKIQGMLDTVLQNWTLYLAVANVQVICVNNYTPYQTMDQLIAALKNTKLKITVATAGQSSAGHIAIETLKKYLGFQYTHLTYNSGKEAAISCVAGETDLVPQLAVEEVDLIRGGKLKPLAVLSDKPLTLKGVADPIPPITKWIPQFKAGSNWFGIWVPNDTPDAIKKTLGKAWDKVIANSQLIKDYALANGAEFGPSWGDEAQKRVMSYLSPVAWLYFEGGKAKISPDTVGIPKP
jgi:tripartite-type tricarboxylate transporter receptor subunit TctC